MDKVVFITGTTGNLGGKLISTTLQGDDITQMVVLIRAGSESDAWRRLESSLAILAPDIDLKRFMNRITVLCGDITESDLGICEETRRALASKVTHIIHSAANVQFTQPISQARQVNVEGTRNVLEFARETNRRGQLQGVAYISTAYVSGNKKGTILEYDSTPPEQFSNSYEQSKWEAEQLVRGLMAELPMVIFRPSIVVGDSKTGRTLCFNVLYTPLRFIHKGMLKVLTCRPDNPLDVVPLDYVCNVINHIFLKTDLWKGKTFNVVAGINGAPRIGDIVKSFVEQTTRHPKCGSLGKIKFVRPELLKPASLLAPGESRLVVSLLKTYSPYLNINRVFDNTNTLAALAGSDITPPSFADYFKNLIDYCLACDWGKQTKKAA